MSISEKFMQFTARDGSVWAVPVQVIAENRAAWYADEFRGSVEQSLQEDTLPLFESDEFEVVDWAQNNINWIDIADRAIQVKPASPPYLQEEWVNADKGIVDTLEPHSP